MTVLDALDAGREAYRTRAWGRAYAQLSAADALEPLGFDDLVLLAQAAELVGRYEDTVEVAERAHREGLRVGDLAGAARVQASQSARGRGSAEATRQVA